MPARHYCGAGFYFGLIIAFKLYIAWQFSERLVSRFVCCSGFWPGFSMTTPLRNVDFYMGNWVSIQSD